MKLYKTFDTKSQLETTSLFFLSLTRVGLRTSNPLKPPTLGGSIVQKQGHITVLRPYCEGFWVYHDQNIGRIDRSVLAGKLVSRPLPKPYFCTMVREQQIVVSLQEQAESLHIQYRSLKELKSTLIYHILLYHNEAMPSSSFPLRRSLRESDVSNITIVIDNK